MSILPCKRKPSLMPNAETTMIKPAFGQTMRADVWWIHPLLVFIGLSTFIVYSTWAAFQGTTHSVLTFLPSIRRNSLAIRHTVGLDRNQAGGRSGFYSRRLFLSFGHRAAFGSPVIIIAALTTKRSGLIRQHARWASRVSRTGASARSRSSCRTRIAISSTSAWSSSSS